MKKLLLLLPLLIFCSCLSGQVGVKFTHIRPTGELGSIVKPTIGGEIVWKTVSEDAGFMLRYGLMVAKFHSRLDTFPTYGVARSYSTTVLPGYTVIHVYNMMSITMGFDYMVSLSDKFLFYPGLDAGVEFLDIEYDLRVETLVDEHYSGGSSGLVARLRAGGQYLIIENLAVFAEVQRNLAFTVENGGFGYNDYGLGVRYNF